MADEGGQGGVQDTLRSAGDSSTAPVALRAVQLIGAIITVGIVSATSAHEFCVSGGKNCENNPGCRLDAKSFSDYSALGFLITMGCVALIWSAVISAMNLFGIGYSSSAAPSTAIGIDAFLAFTLLAAASATSGMLTGLRESGLQYCSEQSSFCSKVTASIVFTFIVWASNVGSLLLNLQNPSGPW